jgi:acetyl esterase/lipase
MRWVLLAWGVLAFLYVVNNRRPARRLPFVLWSWPAAWVASELAPHLIVTGVIGTVLLAAPGGVAGWPGWVGLALIALSVAWTVPLVLRVRRTVVDISDQVEELDPADDRVPYPRSHIVFPLLAYRRGDVAVERGVVYHRRLKLDIYRGRREGARTSTPRPAIVHVHGGAWVAGTRHEQGVPLLGHLAANGWVGFNIDYRLSPRATWPAQVVDVKRAIAWVREHAEELGVDPQRIALTGGSAGGHLTALAALTAGDPGFQPGFEDADTSVAAAVPFYGVYDLLDEQDLHLRVTHMVLERIVFKTRDRETFRRASPIHRIQPDAPPMLVIHGEADSLIPVEEARRFVKRLRAASRNPVAYVELPDAQHAFDVLPSWRTVAIVEAIERFLAASVRPAGAGLMPSSARR